MNYLEIKFKLEPYDKDMADILAAVTTEAGLESFIEDEHSLIGYVQKDHFNARTLEDTLNLFSTMHVNISYSIKEIEDQNWNEEWERNGFKPVLIKERVLIHNGNHANLPKTEYDILINPHQAFGTGNHQTTGLVIERLLDMDINGKKVLDAGCGTGILGIFCAMKGAGNVFAYDIDPWSVRNTIENLQLNHIHIPFQILEGDASILEGKEGFDLVMANINRNILLADMPSFAKVIKKGGMLILSGFYTEDITLLTEKANSLGLTYIDHTEKDNWATLLFRY